MSEVFVYLKHVILGDNEALQKLKQLNDIYKVFKPHKYRYINKDKTVTNLFLMKIYAVFVEFEKFKPHLDSTIFAKDEQKSRLYLNYLIEANISEEARTKGDKFIREFMLQKMKESENPSKTIKMIEEDFLMYKNNFTRSNMPKFETEYNILYKLQHLSTFNYDLFFSKFDPYFNKTKAPAYNPVSGRDIINDLKDLYFLIGSLPTKTDLTNIFTIIYKRVSELDAPKLAKAANNAVAAIYKLCQDELNPQKLLSMCKYIDEKPKLIIPIETKPLSILDKYRHDLDERFAKNKEFVLQKVSEETTYLEIQALFNNKPMNKIKGYTDDLMGELEALGFGGLDSIQGFKITKTFINDIYEKEFRHIINSLIVESFFDDKAYQTKFSDRFFAVNELSNLLSEVENSVAETGANSFLKLESHIKSYRINNNKSIEIKINKMIESINDKLKETNKKSAELLYQLGVHLYEALQDFKNPKPVYITNMKVIKGSGNKEFITAVINIYNSISKYLKIMKNFIVIDTKKAQ